MTSSTRGVLRCAAAAALFGATTPLAARIADDSGAATLAGLLYVGAALGVAPFLRRRPFDRDAFRRGSGRLAVAVLAGGLLGPLLLVAGLQRTPAATSSLLLNLELVATVVLAALFFREHLGRGVLAGTGIVVVAGIVLAWSDVPDLRLGALLIAGACVCWGLDNCVTADLDQIAPEHVTMAKGVVAGGTNLVIGLAVGGAMPGAGQIVGALVLGALGYGLSITLWVLGARDLGAARGQLVFSTAPFIGVAVAWLALGDDARPAEMAALVLAAVGVLIVLDSEHEHRHGHDRIEHEHEHDHDDPHHRHEHELPAGRHTHRHEHKPMVHAHPHVPDLHHRHEHERASGSRSGWRAQRRRHRLRRLSPSRIARSPTVARPSGN